MSSFPCGTVIGPSVVGIGLTIVGVSMGATITGLNLSKDGLAVLSGRLQNMQVLGMKMTGIRTGMRLMNRTVKRQPEQTEKSIW